jgi:succinoglycan biosynthesis transport protein ExoP
MSEHPYLAVIIRYWALVVSAVVLGALAGYGLSALATPVYTSSARLYFAINVGNTGNDLNQGSTYAQAQMLSFAQLAESAVVLEPVIRRLGLGVTPDQLADAITVSTPENTVILEVVASDGDPERAAAIANEVSRSLSSAVDDFAPKTLEGETTVELTSITSATASASPSSPNTRNNVVAGTLVGLLLAIGAIVVRRLFDTRIRSGAMIEGLQVAPHLGTIDFDRESKSGQALLRRASASPAAENYRRVRTNLAQAIAGSGGSSSGLSLVVTSPGAGDGKSTVAMNLALALAEGGQRVILVDADFRNPSLARYTGLDGESGLSTVVAGDADLESVVQHWEPGELDVLTAGPVPKNSSELLTAPTMARLHKRLERDYSFVVFDSPDVGLASDPASLGRLADGVIVVAAYGRTRTPQLAATLDTLDRAGTRVVGIVLNHTRPSRLGERSTAPLASREPAAS